MAWTFYYYTPSSPAAGIFVGLTGLSTVLHFYQLVRTQTWFMIPFIVGGAIETIGKIGRLLSSIEAPGYTKGPYIMQSTLILIAPAFLAASIYMTLGRIIVMLDGEKSSLIKLKWLTKIFVAGDVLSFLMQASGAGIMVKDSTNPSTGEHIVIGGLFLQIVFFGFFMISTLVFQLRIISSPTGRSSELEGLWRRHLTAIYITSVLILEEVFIYDFDGLLMLVAMLVLQYIHPSEINCLIGRGDRYSEKILKTRKFEPRSALEMSGAIDA